MKKLIFVFMALLTVVLIAGCGARQNTVRFNNEENAIEETENSESETVEENTDTDIETEAKTEVEAETEAEHETESETTSTEEDTAASTQTVGKLSVTSMEAAHLKTNLSYNVIKGTAPSNTYKITINGYQLQKYAPGQTQWDYIAATRFNSLKNGTNNYVLKSFDKDGKETGSLIFTIDYEAPSIPEALPDVGVNMWLSLLITIVLTGAYALHRRNDYKI